MGLHCAGHYSWGHMQSHTHLDFKRERWLLITLAGVQFTHILDFMIMMPLGPQLTRIFGIDNAAFGLLVSAYTFSAGLSGLAASFYVDRFDRKRLLLVLYALFALATLACALAPGYGALLAARVAAGLFGGVLSTLSQTIVADVIPFERRGAAMGTVMSSFSLATVAGVPIGLWLANALGWHAPFWSLALVCGLLLVLAYQTLPALGGHLHGQSGRPVWRNLTDVVREPAHWRAFALSSLMMFAGFTVIPYITLYNTLNVGLTESQIPWIYLCGGAATLLTARWVGRLSDRLGKQRVFFHVAIWVSLPLLVTTLLPPVSLWVVLLVSTIFFLLMNARMIPGMALISSAVKPERRGTFMAINGAVQSASMGAAAFVGGLIIGRDAMGHLTLYWVAGLLGVLASWAAAWVSTTLVLEPGASGNSR
jgi:predicted MFS family arabinose efflux permease